MKQKRSTSRILSLALAFSLLAAAPSKAAVTLIFSQVGAEVHATWSGNYLLPLGGSSTGGTDGARISSGQLTGHPGGVSFGTSAGVMVTGVLPSTSTSGTYTGTSFGFAGGFLIWPNTITTSVEYSPVGTMVFSGKTLAGMGVENYSNTLVFTGTGNAGGNREIYLNTLPVPEPSTAAFAFTAGLGLLRRRR